MNKYTVSFGKVEKRNGHWGFQICWPFGSPDFYWQMNHNTKAEMEEERTKRMIRVKGIGYEVAELGF